jgi:hypothetical protein
MINHLTKRNADKNMKLIDILDHLRYTPEDQSYPEDVLEAALAEKEAIAPILLKELEDVFDDPALIAEDEDYMLPLYSMFLLAQLREPKAFTRILNLFSLSPEFVDSCFGTITTESLNSLLASTYGGDLKALLTFIENEDAFGWARSAGARTLVTLYVHGVLARETVQSHLLNLLKIIPYREDDVTLDGVIQAALEIKPEGPLNEKIKELLDLHSFDPFIGLNKRYDDIQPQSVGDVFQKISNNQEHDLIDDVGEHIAHWPCFHQDHSPTKSVKASAYGHLYQRSRPIVNQKKLGRNDPCHCGSGKKVKKCCPS